MENKKNILTGAVVAAMISTCSINAASLFNYSALGTGSDVRGNLLNDASLALKTIDLACGEKKETKTKDAKCGDSKTKDAKCGDSKTKDAKCGDSKTKDAKCGDSKVKDPK